MGYKKCLRESERTAKMKGAGGGYGATNKQFFIAKPPSINYSLMVGSEKFAAFVRRYIII